MWPITAIVMVHPGASGRVVADIALPEFDTLDRSEDSRGSSRPRLAAVAAWRRTAGPALLSTAAASSIAWLGWRASDIGAHPIQLTFFLTEVVSIVSGLIVGVGLAGHPLRSDVLDPDRRESFRFAFAVQDAVGRPRSTDLRADMANLWRRLRHGRPDLSELSTAAMLSDGPRRLLLVVSITLALLLGVAPMGVPPYWAMICAVAAPLSLSCAHVLLSGGRIRFGDRVRWSSAALGEVCAGTDRAGVAPRRWVGTVAAVVTLNLAIGLRGMSDRWTHGLAPMTGDGRLLTMLIANVIVVGGLYTLRTTTAPQLDNSHLVSRRTEEHGARRSALGATVALSVVGLLAGILPVGTQAADGQPVRVEHVSNGDSDPIERIEVGLAPVGAGDVGDVGG